MRAASFASIAVLVITSSVAAEPSAQAKPSEAPYFGAWRCDPARSDLGPMQFTIAEQGDGLAFTDDILKRSYRFRTDGQGYPDADGFTVTWTAQGPRAWLVTYATNGSQIGSEQFRLSDDERTLTSRFILASASPVESVLSRQAGHGTGLVGTWRGKLLAPVHDLEIRPDGTDGLVFRIPDAFEVTARLDGRPYPLTGPLVPKPSTSWFRRTGPRTLEFVTKEGDKTLLDATITVSEDGRTLTESGIAEGGVRKTWVYDRVK